MEHLIILDFEATCDEPKNPSPQEIIEFPSVIVDVEQKKIIDPIQCKKKNYQKKKNFFFFIYTKNKTKNKKNK